MTVVVQQQQTYCYTASTSSSCSMASATADRYPPCGLLSSSNFGGTMPYHDEYRRQEQRRHALYPQQRNEPHSDTRARNPVGRLNPTASAEADVTSSSHQHQTHSKPQPQPHSLARLLSSPTAPSSASSSKLGSTTQRNIHESQPLSKSSPFLCPSAQTTLIEHAASIPLRAPQFQLLVRQHPRHGLALGNADVTQKHTRLTPIDPPPVCELVVKEEAESCVPSDSIPLVSRRLTRLTYSAHGSRFLSTVEVSIRACLVSAAAPYEEVTNATTTKSSINTTEALLGSRVESPFIAPCTKQQDECFFIFTDLGVRHSGRFRLRFDLLDRGNLQFKRVASVYSDVFDVVDDKKAFNGLSPSSELIHAIARRGLRLRIVRRPVEATTRAASTPIADHSDAEKSHPRYDDQINERKRRRLVDIEQQQQPSETQAPYDTKSPRRLGIEDERSYEYSRTTSAASAAREASDAYIHAQAPPRRNSLLGHRTAAGYPAYDDFSSSSYSSSPSSSNHAFYRALPYNASPRLAPLKSTLPPLASAHVTRRPSTSYITGSRVASQQQQQQRLQPYVQPVTSRPSTSHLTGISTWSQQQQYQPQERQPRAPSSPLYDNHRYSSSVGNSNEVGTASLRHRWEAAQPSTMQTFTQRYPSPPPPSQRLPTLPPLSSLIEHPSRRPNTFSSPLLPATSPVRTNRRYPSPSAEAQNRGAVRYAETLDSHAEDVYWPQQQHQVEYNARLSQSQHQYADESHQRYHHQRPSQYQPYEQQDLQPHHVQEHQHWQYDAPRYYPTRDRPRRSPPI